MTAGRISRLDGSTAAPNTGRLSRLAGTTPAAWYSRLSRLSATVPTAIVSNAGADQVDLEPFQLQTLAGTVSGGAAVTHSWRQISGPTVVLSGPTTATAGYKAPGTLAGATLVFGYTAVGSNGVPSMEDTVACAILPVTERAVIGGVEVPLELRSVSGGSDG